MKMKDIRSGVLSLLYETYQTDGSRGAQSESEIARRLPGVEGGVVNDVLERLYENEGLVEHGGSLARRHLWRLTTHGVEAVETPEEAEGIALVRQTFFQGGTFTNVQTGDHSVQNITYSTVLTSLIEAIEKAPDVPPETKRGWTTALRELAAHPLTQTAIQTAATIGAALTGQQ